MKVMLVDDDKDLIEALRQAYELEDIEVDYYRNPLKALNAINENFEGAVVTDVRMPEMDGIDLFQKIQAIDPKIPVIVMTGHADVPMVLSVLKQGVSDFLAKPIVTEELISTTLRACESRALVLENRRLRQLTDIHVQADMLIGESRPMVQLREMIAQIASAEVDILIEGETGTGKQTVANLIHKLSKRARHRFVTANCASIANDSIQEELFGIDGTSQANYHRRRTGKIMEADRGFLHLNKLDSASVDLQGQLLRFVETREITPIGSTESRKVDARIIASSTPNLHELVADKGFRSDLFFRLSTIKLKIPPLRERPEDIPLLFAHFLNEASEKLQKKIPRIKADARRHLYEHDWPGNVQELKNYAKAIVLGISHTEDNSEQAQLTLPKRIEHFEAALIKSALQQSSGNVPETLKILGIPRKTFYDKINRHNLDLSQFRI